MISSKDQQIKVNSDEESIVLQIEREKAQLNNRFQLKEKTTAFNQLLFKSLFDVSTSFSDALVVLKARFGEIGELLGANSSIEVELFWHKFIAIVPNVLKDLNRDAIFILENDPAAKSIEEVYLSYPGFYAIAIYRLSHQLHLFNIPIIPRLMTECAHSTTGIDINPGARIGVPFFIDHGTGVVIGETAEIANHVKIYQGVTLGALSVKKSMQEKKRHPSIESKVTIYANATILGGKTVIGENSTIGGNVWLTKSVPPNSMVSHKPNIEIKTNI